jgi:hypothetical protein
MRWWAAARAGWAEGAAAGHRTLVPIAVQMGRRWAEGAARALVRVCGGLGRRARTRRACTARSTSACPADDVEMLPLPHGATLGLRRPSAAQTPAPPGREIAAGVHGGGRLCLHRRDGRCGVGDGGTCDVSGARYRLRCGPAELIYPGRMPPQGAECRRRRLCGPGSSGVALRYACVAVGLRGCCRGAVAVGIAPKRPAGVWGVRLTQWRGGSRGDVEGLGRGGWMPADPVGSVPLDSISRLKFGGTGRALTEGVRFGPHTCREERCQG